VDSPLTEEACEVIYKLPDLCELSVVIEGPTSLPTMVLPNLIAIDVEYNYDHNWSQGFREATLEKNLTSVAFHCNSEAIGDFLETFERVTFAASAQNTLSIFRFYTLCSWNPNYSSLLPFTQLTYLIIEFSCDDGCSSRVDDDIIINFARTMPKLDILLLGDPPCRQIPTGVTVKGLAALAHHCPNLSTLRIHFQVASLSAPPAIARAISSAEPIARQKDCALTDFEVGEIPVPEESVWIVALTLVRIFPHIESVDYADESWEKVSSAIRLSGRIADCSSKEHPLIASSGNFSNISPGATLEGSIVD
jgi:hypothetical protein